MAPAVAVWRWLRRCGGVRPAKLPGERARRGLPHSFFLLPNSKGACWAHMASTTEDDCGLQPGSRVYLPRYLKCEQLDAL